MESKEPPASRPDDAPPRRSFLGQTGGAAMALALATSYGTCGAYGLRFLYPARPPRRIWQFVAVADRLQPGESMPFRAPDGQRITVARQGEAGTVEDFIALGSTCPHLGCQVHWQPDRQRFFCPCHNGVFDPRGKGIGGPPGEAGQSLPRFPLKLEGGLLYIEVPAEGLLV